MSRARLSRFTDTYRWLFLTVAICTFLELFVFIGIGFSALGPLGPVSYVIATVSILAFFLARRKRRERYELDDRVPEERRQAALDYILSEFGEVNK